MNWLVITPDISYKLELIEMLLRSIDMDFSDNSLLYERWKMAQMLCQKVEAVLLDRQLTIFSELEICRQNNKKSRFTNLNKCIDLYNKYIKAIQELKETIDNFDADGTQDGRYFRDVFPEGYRDMLDFFKEEY